jgi:pyruvate formate lyase activating enzyme
MESGSKGLIDYEFRTTVVGGIHTENDFIKIGKWLKGAKAYFLQGYRTSEDQLNPVGLSTVPVETMEHYKEILLPNIPNTQLRGVV